MKIPNTKWRSQVSYNKRIAEVLEHEDADIIWDLRAKNQGHPEKYVFLEHCRQYIESQVNVAVDDRRHDSLSNNDHLPVLAQASYLQNNLQLNVYKLHEKILA